MVWFKLRAPHHKDKMLIINPRGIDDVIYKGVYYVYYS
jgi:hypothetical protein